MFRRARSNKKQQAAAAGEESAVRDPGKPKKKPLEKVPVIGPIWSLYRGYSRRNGPLLAAGIAYYGLFAAAPLMLLTLEVAGIFVGVDTAQEEITDVMSQFFGEHLASLFSSILVQMQRSPSTTFILIGIGVILYAATRLFIRLQVSVNIMWDVRLRSREFSMRRLLSRLATFALILVPAALVVVSLALNAGVTWLRGFIDGPDYLLTVAQSVIPFLAMWLALTVIYMVLPDVRLGWKDTWLGALCVSICVSVGTWGFGKYLGWTASQKYAGTIGALIALIVWVDFMAVIMLLGVRLNKAISVYRGRVPEPYAYAAYVTDPFEEQGTEPAPTTTVQEKGLAEGSEDHTGDEVDGARTSTTSEDDGVSPPAEGGQAPTEPQPKA